MTQTEYYFDKIIFALNDLDLDIADDASLDDIRDAFHNYAHYETYLWYGDTNGVNLCEKQVGKIEELLVKYFG